MFKRNDIIKVKVINKTEEFVSIVTLDNPTHTDISKTEISWIQKLPWEEDNVNINDILDATVLFSKEQTLYLSLKKHLINPFNEIHQNNKEGDFLIVNPIKNTDIGLFVRTENGVNGIVHQNDIPEDYIFNFNPLKLKIIHKDLKNGRLLFSF